MALRPKAGACTASSCKELTIKDITGVYSASNNTTGWGTPNIDPSDVTEATLTITLPSGTEESFDVTTEVSTATLVNGQFTIDTYTMANFGGESTTAFANGEYTVVQTYIAGEVTYTGTCTMFITCKAKCCIEKMRSKFKEWYCEPKTFQNKMMQYYEAKTLLDAARSSYACNKKSDAFELLGKVEKLCSINNCNC